jgi:uncharacterized phage protein gp47/JayE
VSFIDRTYPDIVRDVLTNLTQGVTREIHRIVYDPEARPAVVPDVTLLQRPVRRVSFVQGFIPGRTPADEVVPYLFTPNDYELVGDTPDARDLNTIRFLPFGRKPASDTDLTVNYYPRNTDPAPINDLNVGSVGRTLLEAVSRELALIYAQLNQVYDSAFLETASGPSLERVVALLGYQRYRAGRATGAVVFTRRAGARGDITIPAGTPVTDTTDRVRYETVETRSLRAGESTAQVRVRGVADSTPPVEAGVLRVVQRALAGIDGVDNPRPTSRVNEAESDEQLRERARAALVASNKGTLDSIKHGLLQLPDVRDVKIDEIPNGVAGEILVNVSLADDSTPGELPPSVTARLEELRPAGIRVIQAVAQALAIEGNLTLTLAGSHLPPVEIEQVKQAATTILTEEIDKKGVGEKVRAKPLVAALLADDRIVDAEIRLGVAGEAPGEPDADFATPDGTAVRLEGLSFAEALFDQPLAAEGQAVNVEVRATVAAELLTGVSLEQASADIEAKLAAYFGALPAGAIVDVDSVLQALRDDTQYAIDRQRLKVTLDYTGQFVQLLEGAAPFTVELDQSFQVVAVEVTP